MKTKENKEEIEELGEVIENIEVGERVRVKIIKDNVQTSIRIPKRFVGALAINSEKDEFEFLFNEEEQSLSGRLIKDGKKEEF